MLYGRYLMDETNKLYKLLLNNSLKIYTIIEIYKDYVVLQRDLNDSDTKTYWAIDNFNRWFEKVETTIPMR